MKRFWEIDALRGIAIITMIIFHTTFILILFEFLDTDLYTGFWWVFPRCIAGTFLLLVGVSLTISYNRIKDSLSRDKIIKKYLLRGGMLLLMGFVITIGSYFVFGPESFVLFGILHLIGTMIIIAIPFLSFKIINLVMGCLVLGSGLFLGLYRFDFYWLLWLGFRPEDYFPVDYLPLLPWACFVFFGMFAGNLFYRENKRLFPLPEIGDFFLIKGLRFMGRHSIYFYLAHIPVIYGIVYGVRLLFPG